MTRRRGGTARSRAAWSRRVRSEKEGEAEILPFVHFLVVVAAREYHVVAILGAQHETAGEIELQTAADVADLVVAVDGLHERRLRLDVEDAGAEREVRRDARSEEH